MEPTSDTILAGKYRLVRQLGRGGMGSVWLAQHLTLDSPVAIKLMDPSIVSNHEALQRFWREAQSAASLRSPHVVQILDHGVDQGTPYIAMELLDGESLADRLTRVGALGPPETARIMTQVARALRRAHEAGIVHRDLKPDNIYIVRNDEEEVAKVLDFGIAKATTQGLGSSAASGTRTGAMLGTPYYMSPEQAEGVRTLDHRTDIWAIGVIAFECLVGRRPFDAETLGSLLLAICTRPLPIPSQWAQVPAGFDAWFARACAREVGERYASVKDAAADLKAVCEGAPPSAVTPSPYSAVPNQVQAAVPAASMISTSGGFSATGQQPRKGSGGAVIALFAGLVVLGGMAVGGFLAWQKFTTPEPEIASAAVASPSVAAPPPPVATQAPATEIIAPVVSASAAAAAAPSVAPAPVAAPVVAKAAPIKAKVVKPAAAPVKAPAKATEPAPKPAATPDKPKVNLGI